MGLLGGCRKLFYLGSQFGLCPGNIRNLGSLWFPGRLNFRDAGFVTDSRDKRVGRFRGKGQFGKKISGRKWRV